MIRLVVFDAYGTLFDVYSVGAMAESLFPGQGASLSILWRDKQIEYSRLISLSDPLNPLGSRHYQSFWDITRLALQYSCQRLQLELTPAKQKQLMDQYSHLQPFEENLEVLQSLKKSQPSFILLGSISYSDPACHHEGSTAVTRQLLPTTGYYEFRNLVETRLA